MPNVALPESGVFLTLKCSGCGRQKVFAGATWRIVEKQIVDAQWVLSEGRAECPSCFADYKRGVEHAAQA